MNGKQMEILVGMGEIKLAQPPDILKAVGIGSCLVIIMYDHRSRVGSLAHVMLPHAGEAMEVSRSEKFVDVAVGKMVDAMKRHGSQVSNIRAKLFGGANMFPDVIASGSEMDIGWRNVLAAREEIGRFHIEITAEEIKDHIGRSVLFDTRDGSVVVQTAVFDERTY